MARMTKKQIRRITDRLKDGDMPTEMGGDFELAKKTKYHIDPQDWHESRATSGNCSFKAHTPMEALLQYILANRTIEGCQGLEIKRVKTSSSGHTHEVKEYPENGLTRYHCYTVEIKGVV